MIQGSTGAGVTPFRGRAAKISSRACRLGSRSSSQAPFYGGRIEGDARRPEELTY